ncbi:hypothetical protein M8J77_023608 [Diaphorina citri]|nr:hypothetical protein M8J77_023608 [Diaphorina citri]
MSDEEPAISSSSSEEEDEYGKELTLDVEKKFLKTLQSLKTKDPSIYDAQVKFFDTPEESKEEVEEPKENKKKKKAKPFLLSDYDKLLVKSGGEIKEEADVLPSYNQEQEEIKSNLKKALLDSDDSDDENSSLLTLKPKTTKSEDKAPSDEETEIHEWLMGNKEKVKNKEIEKELKPLHDIWTNPELDDGESFLRDYILKKRYIDESQTEAASPSASEADSDEFDSKQEEFEHKYNFRFEEPDQEFIKRYPRTMENSMRRRESKRKLQRELAKKNREEKLEKKKAEMKKMKREKREEILAHLNSLQNITGNKTMAFKEDMLNGEFNPDEHDKIMESLFNEEFYAGQDEEKPVFEDDDDDFDYPDPDEENAEGDEDYYQNENYNEDGGDYNEDEGDYNKGQGDYNGDHGDNDQNGGGETEYDGQEFDANGELITDCDYDPSKRTAASGRKLSRSKLKRLKRKEKLGQGADQQKSLFAQAVAKPKPKFNPKDETFMKYVDEYYGLEFEDLIGDLPCRFKYKRVVPNSFGLTIDEILAADDKDLNKWCAIKKIYSNRSEHVEKNEVKVYSQRARNEDLKRKLLPSLYKPPEDGDEEEEEPQRILPTEEERQQMMNKKQKKIQQISAEFETGKKTKKNADNEEEKEKEEKEKKKEKEDVIDESIVNEYLKEKKKSERVIKEKRKMSTEGGPSAKLKKISANASGITSSAKNGKTLEIGAKSDLNQTSDKLTGNKRKANGEIAKKKSSEDKKSKGGKIEDLSIEKVGKNLKNNNEKSNIINVGTSIAEKVEGKDNVSTGKAKKKKKKSISGETLVTTEKDTKDGSNANETCDSQKNETQQTPTKGEKKKKKRKKKKKKKAALSGEGEKEGEGSGGIVKKKEKKTNINTKGKEKENSQEEKKPDKKKASLTKKINEKQSKLKAKKGGKGGDKLSKKGKGTDKFNKKSKDKVTDLTDERLKAYGINPKKFKSKLIYGNKGQV